MGKTRFGNYHESGYRPRRQWTPDERLADLLRIADLLERGGALPSDREMFRQHIDALRPFEAIFKAVTS